LGLELGKKGLSANLEFQRVEILQGIKAVLLRRVQPIFCPSMDSKSQGKLLRLGGEKEVSIGKSSHWSVL
jgi:hypothetical protein